MTPMEAALQGRRRDRLHHHLDQPLAGRGVHPAAADGRHRRPAVPRVRDHRDDDHRGLGARLADADADDVLALPAAHEQHERHGRLYRLIERGFDAHARRLHARALDIVLRHQLHHAAGVPRHRGARPVVLYIVIPKGFFPQQDTGFIIGISEAAQDISFDADGAARSSSSPTSSRRTRTWPACRHRSAPAAASRSTTAASSSALKPRDERARRSADEIIARLRPKLAQVQGVDAVPAGRAGHQRRRPRSSRTQYQYTLQDADLDELNAWAPKMLDELQQLPQLRDVATDQQIGGTTADADHRPRPGRALRHPAAADRRHALRRVRPAPGRAVLHAAQQLPRDPGGHAGAAGRPDDAATSSTSSRRSPASRCRCRPS